MNESRGLLRAAACWMHARREFDEARVTTSHSFVEETLARIRLLYDVEDRVQALSFEERRALRDRESRPFVVERLFAIPPTYTEAVRHCSPTAEQKPASKMP